MTTTLPPPDAHLALVTRWMDGRVVLVWPTGRPDWTPVGADALEQYVDELNRTIDAAAALRTAVTLWAAASARWGARALRAEREVDSLRVQLAAKDLDLARLRGQLHAAVVEADRAHHPGEGNRS